ncbi:MAG: alpha/beta hydrolase [Bacteroidota bacterium]
MKLKQKLAIGYIRAKFKMLTLVNKRKAAEKAFELFCTPFMKAEVRVPAIFSKAEQLHFQLNGMKVHGFRWKKENARTVLILHGFTSAAHKFHQYITSFIDKGYQVLAFDAPAHGSSEGKTVNAVQYAEMITKVIALYGPVDSFLAHSFGGIALSLALENLPHSENNRIVLIAPATETCSAVDGAFKMLQIKDEEVRRQFDNIIFEQSGQQTSWFSINRALKKIEAKILWIHDEDDDVTPWADALKVKEQSLANIEFIVTKGLGHRKIYGDFHIRNKVIDFL